MIIRFKNWEKFNPTSSHTASWVRLSSNICSKGIWDELSHAQFRVFIYMLCQANENEKRGQFILSSRSASRRCDTSEKEVIQTVEILKRFQVIETRAPSGLFVGSEETPTTNETNERTNERTNTLAGSPVGSPELDFEGLYKKYPRKEGKGRGLKTCKVQIKNAQQYEQLSKAIDKYAAHCQKTATEPRYIKHFGTFMTSWRDWLDQDVGADATLEASEPEWIKEARRKEKDELQRV